MHDASGEATELRSHLIPGALPVVILLLLSAHTEYDVACAPVL